MGFFLEAAQGHQLAPAHSGFWFLEHLPALSPQKSWIFPLRVFHQRENSKLGLVTQGNKLVVRMNRRKWSLSSKPREPTRWHRLLELHEHVHFLFLMQLLFVSSSLNGRVERGKSHNVNEDINIQMRRTIFFSNRRWGPKWTEIIKIIVIPWLRENILFVSLIIGIGGRDMTLVFTSCPRFLYGAESGNFWELAELFFPGKTKVWQRRKCQGLHCSTRGLGKCHHHYKGAWVA